MRDFIPWVRPKSNQPPDSEEEEEEEMTGLLDRYVARKRKRQEDAALRVDTTPDQAAESRQPATGCSSEEQAIIIPGLPEMGSNDHLDIGERCPEGVGGGRSDTIRALNDPSSCLNWKPARQVRVHPYQAEEA